MEVLATWYGTAAIHLAVDDALGILFDPYLERPADARPRIAVDPRTVRLDPLDVVLVSHSHFDHIYNLLDVLCRYPGAQAYVPEVTVENCRRLCSGMTFKDRVREFSDSDWERVHTVTVGERVEGASRDGRVRFRAAAMQSGHVRFDAYSVLRVVLNSRVVRRLPHYLKYLFRFPMKEVLGWELRLESSGEPVRIVFFGSLCDRYPQILLEHRGSDWLFLPLAGRRNVLPSAARVTEALRPKTVIPVHYDDFFPPISYPVDYRNYSEWLERTLPGTEMIELQPGVPTPLRS
jgi:hypothetical protein